MGSVHISGAHKRFGATHVLRGVDVTVADGEFCVLVGPSGCGKSTLLRMIAGLEDITEGEIRVGGRVVNDLEPKERDIAMVFQSYALYPHMTVADNISFALNMARVPRVEIDKRVSSAAEMLELDKLLKRFPRELSGGQRQRVAMGRAIVRAPQVFLFDEPLSNLDAKLRVQMRAQIKELHQRLKTTSIFVTHDQIEAMTMADKIVVMRDGLVEQIGSPLELYDRPANTFVATFIGSPSMNLLSGVVRSRAGVPYVEIGNAQLPLNPAVKAEVGQAVLYGVRPEQFTFAGGQGFEAEVVVVEPTGSDTQIHCRANGRDVTAVARQRMNPRVGEPLHLVPDPMQVCVFDAADGQLLRAA